MANIYSCALTYFGGPTEVKEMHEGIISGGISLPYECLISQEIGEEDSRTYGDVAFDSRSQIRSEEIRTLSERFPNVVITLATVELASLIATASVWKSGELVGEYAEHVSQL